MKAAIYCRVSTDDQEKEGTSLKTQMESCLNYCHEKGYEVSHRFSEAYSGLTLDRPKLRELQELIRAGYIDVIVIYCLDRISRDPTHGVILTQEFERLNVALEAVTEDINTSELGKLISYIRGFASKLEAEKIRERTMRGKMAYLKDGKLPQGTGIGIYGYSWDKTTGKRQIIDHEADTVRKMFKMAINGVSTNKIALTFNQSDIRTKSGSLWYPLTVRRILRNQTYTGKTYFGQTKRVGKTKVEAQPKETWILLPDITPPILTDEIFNRAQEVMKDARDARPVKPNAAYLLTGFMKCPKCASPIGGTTMNGKFRYYRCRGSVPTATRGKICDAGYIKANDLEKSVLKKVVEMITSPLTVLSLFSDIKIAERAQPQKKGILLSLDKEINHFRRKLKAYPDKEKNLYDLLSHESITKDYVLEAVSKLKNERINDERQLKDLLSTRKEMSRANQVTIKLSEVSEELRTNALYIQQTSPETTENIEEKRRILEDLHLKIVVNSKPLDYKLTFSLYGQIISTEESETEATFSRLFNEYAQEHPDINFDDYVDPGKPLPGNSPFAQSINRAKNNLVTIEQTSGCLSTHAYLWAVPFSFVV